VIIAWGLQPVKDALDAIGTIKIPIPGLHEVILSSNGQTPIAQIFKFNMLSASGTAILISVLISIAVIGMKFSDAFKLFIETCKQLKFTVITIASVLGFAYLANNSGISNTLAMTLTLTGVFFPFFSPILGWLGVFLTGSDTSSNALFGKLQTQTAQSLGIDPVITVAANTTGGVTGKMISPQSIAVGVASVGLIGKESDLFRFAVKHSFILVFVLCIFTTLQAYFMDWFIPKYEMLSTQIATVQTDFTLGFTYLGVLALLVIGLVVLVKVLNKKR
jgi:lactate permease